MAWTISEFLGTVLRLDFLGEVVVEFGDIESSDPNPEQKTVTLLTTEGDHKPSESQLIEAWDYGQQWADFSGRPVRLRISGSIEGSTPGSYGVKTFTPRIEGGVTPSGKIFHNPQEEWGEMEVCVNRMVHVTVGSSYSGTDTEGLPAGKPQGTFWHNFRICDGKCARIIEIPEKAMKAIEEFIATGKAKPVSDRLA